MPTLMCPSCKVEVPAAGQFCPRCGKELQPNRESPKLREALEQIKQAQASAPEQLIQSKLCKYAGWTVIAIAVLLWINKVASFWPMVVVFLAGGALHNWGERKEGIANAQLGRGKRLTREWFEKLPAAERDRLREWADHYLTGEQKGGVVVSEGRTDAARAFAIQRAGNVPAGFYEMLEQHEDTMASVIQKPK